MATRDHPFTASPNRQSHGAPCGHLYPGTQHGFNNDTTPRFDATAAKLAWEWTVAHFNKYLR